MSEWKRHPLARLDFGLAAGAAVAGFAARWPLIARGGTLLNSDEAIVGMMAQDVAAGRRWPLYFDGQRYMGGLESWLIGVLPISDWLIRIRVGPALFFAALVALQHLMVTRWFGRGRAWVGTLALIVASPMFAQWSISARGGYIETLLWGTPLMWLYGESLADGQTPKPLQVFGMGLLVGSGMWISPMVGVFVAPIAVHASLPFLGRGLEYLRANKLGLLALPLIALAGVMAANIASTRWADAAGTHDLVLLGLVPVKWGRRIVKLVALGVAVFAYRRIGFAAIRKNALIAAPFLHGWILGNIPAIAYLIIRVRANLPLEPSVPVGLRPLWKIGGPLMLLPNALVAVLAPDPRHVFRHFDLAPVPWSYGLAADLIVAVALLIVLIRFVHENMAPVASAFRVEPGVRQGPAAFLLLGAVGMLALYVLGPATCCPSTSRYVIPMWAFLPGLIAAAAGSRVGRGAALVAIAAWSAGELALVERLSPEPKLARVAAALEHENLQNIAADETDAHLLSFLTGQRIHVLEFQPFWPRLARFRAGLPPPTTYLVHPEEVEKHDYVMIFGSAKDNSLDTLRPMILRAEPGEVLARRPLVDGWEVVTLAHPLPELPPPTDKIVE